MKSGDFFSIGLMTNFLSLNDIFRISLHGKPILGVNLDKKKKVEVKFKNKKNANIFLLLLVVFCLTCLVYHIC